MRKNLSIVKPAYALATSDGHSAELELYGDIYETRPVDWWTGEPIEGQFILLDEFMEDLKEIEGCDDITIRINSYGGDAGVSNTIHNRLRELARSGAKLTCIVDGVAMSGGSIIMCAGDTVRANPSSLIMIHKCWTFLFGGYNADEMRQQAEQNDAWDRMQSEIYQRKTGLPNDTILAMMGETTYMTGREAMEKGFVDELIEDAEPVSIAASADGRSLIVAGRTMHLCPGMFAPDSIPTAPTEASAPEEAYITPVVTGGEEGGNSMTIEELREQFPEQVAQVEAEARAAVDNTEAIDNAVHAERDRLSGIDEVAGLFDPELVREAKYGEHPMTAAELALEAAQRAARAGSQFLADARDDAEAANTADVGSAPAPEESEPETPEAKRNSAKAAVRAIFHKDEKED